MAAMEDIFQNDSNVLQDGANGNDYFAGLMNNNWWKNIGLIFSCLGIITSPLVLQSIIWFERYGNDNKRTLLNMFVSMYCWVVIEFVFFVQILETARFFIGPLPAFVCQLHAYFRGTLGNVLLLYKNASIITRYIFIFWLKNPAAFNNEFWCRMISIWVHIFSLLFCGIEESITTNMSINYYICIGKKPHLTGPPAFNGALDLFTIVVHIFVYIRIYFYKRHGKEGKNMTANKKFTVKDVETR